jgi:hypothetical protein
MPFLLVSSSAEKSLIRHLKWINESQIVYLEYSSEREGEMLSVLDVDFENSKTQLRCRQFVDKQALRLYCNADSKDLLLQLVDGKIHYGKSQSSILYHSSEPRYANECCYLANLEELEFENTGSEEHQETNLLYYHPLMTLPGPCQWIGTTSRVLESGEKKVLVISCVCTLGLLAIDAVLPSLENPRCFIRPRQTLC